MAIRGYSAEARRNAALARSIKALLGSAAYEAFKKNGTYDRAALEAARKRRSDERLRERGLESGARATARLRRRNAARGSRPQGASRRQQPLSELSDSQLRKHIADLRERERMTNTTPGTSSREYMDAIRPAMAEQDRRKAEKAVSNQGGRSRTGRPTISYSLVNAVGSAAHAAQDNEVMELLFDAGDLSNRYKDAKRGPYPRTLARAYEAHYLAGTRKPDPADFGVPQGIGDSIEAEYQRLLAQHSAAFSRIRSKKFKKTKGRFD